jgi:hypothetical protein
VAFSDSFRILTQNFDGVGDFEGFSDNLHLAGKVSGVLRPDLESI